MKVYTAFINPELDPAELEAVFYQSDSGLVWCAESTIPNASFTEEDIPHTLPMVAAGLIRLWVLDYHLLTTDLEDGIKPNGKARKPAKHRKLLAELPSPPNDIAKGSVMFPSVEQWKEMVKEKDSVADDL